MTEAMLAESRRRVDRYTGQALEAAQRASVHAGRAAPALVLLAAAIEAVVATPLDRAAIERSREYLARLQAAVAEIEQCLAHAGTVSEVARGLLVQAEQRGAELRVLAEARDVSSSQLEAARKA